MSKDLKVLIVDDSAFMRSTVARIVNSTEGLTVAGKAMNGRFALKKITSLDPDVIVLDLEMPEMNGIEFLKERKRRGIETPVVILSSLASKGARITMEALSLGASDFVMKPADMQSVELSTTAATLVQQLKGYGSRYRHRKKGKETGTPAREAEEKKDTRQVPIPAPVSNRNVTAKIEVVAIGVSTGGPAALRQVFAAIDPALPVPILVVQHMPSGFTYEFAASLDRICPLPVKEAEDGDILKAGRVFIAPGSHHMVIAKRRLANTVLLTEDAPVNGHRPSVDVLFSSLYSVFENKILAILMTGMGKDGVREIGTIYNAGGITVAQDSESCVVYGMPRVAFENGFIDSVVTLDGVAKAINRFASTAR